MGPFPAVCNAAAIHLSRKAAYNCILLRTLPKTTYFHSANMNVFVSRNVPVSGIELLKSANINITQWKHDEVVPREVLLERAKGIDGLFCLLTDKVDKELLDAAGKYLYFAAV